MAEQFWPIFPFVSSYQHCHSTKHQTVHKSSGLSWWYKQLLWQKCRHIFPQTISKQFWPSIPFCATVSTLSHNWASNSPQTQWVVVKAQAVAMARKRSYFVLKPWPSNFDPLFPVVPPFQHCHITQHQILHKPSRLSWWYRPLLGKLGRHILSKTHSQAILIPLPFKPPFQHCHMTQHRTLHTPSGLPLRHKPSLWQQKHLMLSNNNTQANFAHCYLLCHGFNTVSWLSIELSTNPVGCHSVAMATMTSYLTENHGNNFNPLFPLMPTLQIVIWFSIEFSTTPVGFHGGRSRRYRNNDYGQTVFTPYPFFCHGY